jgi:hypothetical protein
MTVFWDVAPCSPVEVHRCFRGAYFLHRSRGSSVSIVSGYRLNDRAIGVRSPAGAKDFYFNLCVQTGFEARVLSPGQSAAGV